MLHTNLNSSFLRNSRALLLLLSLPLSLGIHSQKLNIGFVYPAGGAQGSTFEVEVGGQNLTVVNGASISGEGVKVTFVELSVKGRAKGKRDIQDQDNLQIAQRVKLRIEVAKDAPLGIRDFRLNTTSGGVSNRLFFEISQPQELVSTNGKEGNNTLSSALVAKSLPVVFNGQCLPGQNDYFRFSAKAGQTIVCHTLARTLIPYLADAVPGWFQPVLTLVDAQTLREVDYSDDYLFNPDPTIVYKAERTADYILKINDAIYRGREDFLYRIHVGELPFIQSIFPLGGARRATTRVQLAGVNLSGKELRIKGKGDVERLAVSTKGKSGLWSNQVPFELSDLVERFEPDRRKPSEGAKGAVEISIGEVMNGRIAQTEEIDWYSFSAKRNDRVKLEVTARRLGSPVDAKLTLYSPDGKILMTVDDTPDKSEGLETHHADPSLTFRAKESGLYFVRLEDAQSKGGVMYGYRLKLLDFTPDYELRIDPPNMTIPQGGTAVFKVSVIRKNDFQGAVELEFPGLSKEYSLSSTMIPERTNSLRITVTASETAPIGPIDFRIKGKARSENGELVVKEAVPAEEQMQAFYIMHLVPTSHFNVRVADPLPFSVSIEKIASPLVLVKDGVVPVKVFIKRQEGFVQPISLVLSSPPNGVKMKPVTVEANQTEAVIEIESANGTIRPKEDFLVVTAMVRPQKNTGRTLGNARNNLSASIMNYLPAFKILNAAYTKEESRERRKL